jgi:nicotinamidase-related amidase
MFGNTQPSQKQGLFSGYEVFCEGAKTMPETSALPYVILGTHRYSVRLHPRPALSFFTFILFHQWFIFIFVMQNLDPRTTALVLIDLQKGIMGRSLAPYSGTDIVKTGGELAERFRAAGAPVILVNVAFAPDFKDALRQPVDQPFPMPPGGFPPDFSELVDGLKKPGDLCITKHQWGAFYGTEMDLQLRRRGIQTIVLGGVATNIGVESTARQAWEHGYALVFAEDATTGMSAEMHDFSFKYILPRLGKIAKAGEIGFK